jgi:hypothetical protein
MMLNILNHRRFHSLATACVLLTLLLPGCSSYRAEKKLEQAARLGAEGKVVEALDLLRDIERDHPETDAARRAVEMQAIYEGLVDARLRYPVRQAVDILRDVATAIEKHRFREGRLPESLEELVPSDLTSVPNDPWGTALVFHRRGDGYLLMSLGADGTAAGSGLSMDLKVEDGELTAAPSWAEW